jgi:hypothetical protein
MQALSDVHTPPARAGARRALLVLVAPGIALALTALTLALRQVSPARFARFWDDALFFRRVAYNIIHHGTAAWNQLDGPVFVNTSQLFQLVAAGLFALFPGYYNAAVIFWSAACIAASWWFCWRAAQTGNMGSLLLFCLLHAPAVFLTIATGMETATVLLVLSSFIHFSLRGIPSKHGLLLMTSLQLAVYLARPDALLLSMVTAPGLLALQGKLKNALLLVGATLVALALLSGAFAAYYGTPVPLAAFLKVSPISIYDQHYLGLGLSSKLMNLTQLGLLVLPVVPVIALRLDRINVVLSAAAVTFIAFHALTTNEIMGYHARFYAPALPFLFVAAARGLQRADRPWKRAMLIAVGVLTLVLVTLAYRADLIEVDVGMAAVGPHQYLLYFAGVPLVAALMFFKPRIQRGGALVAALALASYQMVSTAPAAAGVVSDGESDWATFRINKGQAGLDIIKKCFPEPVRLMHSELGLPGALFPESSVLDFTGLANRAVVNGTFDFEDVCRSQAPEFIFRPHETHRNLNRELSASKCLAKGYTQVVSRRMSLCPLFVRNDLLQTYKSCKL